MDDRAFRRSVMRCFAASRGDSSRPKRKRRERNCRPCGSRGSRARREAGDGVAARMSLSSVLLLQMVSDTEVGFASYLQLCYNWYQMQGNPSVSAENHIAKVDSLIRMIFSALVS